MVISRLVHDIGATVEEVMEQYHLNRPQVLACLTYYYDHQAEIERTCEEHEAALHQVATPLEDPIAQLRSQLPGAAGE